MTKAEANVYIRIAGVFGLIAVIFSLTSATFRLPGTPITVFSGLTPLIGVEFVHNKAELAAILGPMGSENRNVITRRNAAPGVDLVSSFILFLLALYKLTRRLKPHLSFWCVLGIVLLGTTLLLEHFVVSRLAAAAAAPAITEEMVKNLRTLVFFKWDLLFISTVLCTGLLAAPDGMLGFGTDLLAYSAAAATIAVSYNPRLVAPIVLVMFVGLCGVSALLAFRPESLYELPEAEARATASQG